MSPELTKRQVLRAFKHFDTRVRSSISWSGWENRRNHKYAIREDGILYPVKKIVSLATGVHVRDLHGGDRPGYTNRMVKSLGFNVVPLRKNGVTRTLKAGEAKRTFLITWKPHAEYPESNWPDSELRKRVESFRKYGRTKETWPFASGRKASAGDRVFLLRQGKLGPTIFGYGLLSKNPRKIKDQWFADIDFEGIVDPATEVYASRSEVRSVSRKNRIWGNQSSGTELPENVARRLEALVVGRKPIAIGGQGTDWSDAEVIATVADYLGMLLAEARNEKYIKSQHNAELRKKLNGRSKAAVELKHQNISAIMQELDLPFIPGYKPRGHRQAKLLTEVEKFVAAHPKLISEINAGLSTPAKTIPNVGLTAGIFVTAPIVSRSRRRRARSKIFPGTKIDYAGRDAANSELGRAGEEYVAKVESKRLIEQGRRDLARKVEHVSITRGDGLGYDVLSFNPKTGMEIYIEVKTTNGGKDSAFFITSGELDFSKKNPKKSCLYRVFHFRTGRPKIYTVNGDLSRSLNCEPTQFRAWPL